MKRQFAHASTLMVQGTTSDAGKSILVAGLCRVLARHQCSVAPFKPQNMALNSAVTIDGGEIGRSQALQAQACFLPPHTDFNPVLLKPSSDIGAQVIIHGHAAEVMRADEYHDYKRIAMDAVLASHQRLSQQYKHIIVEGAGSPAEINLRENDIANMGFAEAIDCPVIIVADIDRGGVFAHLVGTLALLSQSEQDRVVGFVINRFRGDLKLLESGLEWLEQRTSKPVLAVLPYLQNFYLDAEDAINTSQRSDQEHMLRIVVPVLPRISNHTDFDALRLHPNVNLTFVALEQPCPPADLIILPGSKNVRADLHTLQAAGWQQQLEKHLRYGGKVLGICGGYQMLGHKVNDPDGIEDTAGSSAGFGLLDMVTTLKPSKTLSNVSGEFLHPDLLGVTFQGYEIHCGVSCLSAGQQTRALMSLSRQASAVNNGLHQENITPYTTEQDAASAGVRMDGAYSDDNQILGTYVHGLFDQAEAGAAILSWAGLSADLSAQSVALDTVREQQLERLADTIEQHFSAEFLQTLIPDFSN